MAFHKWERETTFVILMADVHSKEIRSFNMSQIRGKDTKPEMLVRRFLPLHARYYFILFICTLAVLQLSAQTIANGKDEFKLLKQKLSGGDKNALLRAAYYLRDTSSYIQFTMEGDFKTTKSQMARSILKNHTLFLATEFNIDDTTKRFEKFFNVNKSAIYFDSITHKFLITPVSKREAVYKLYSCENYTNNNIDSLINLLVPLKNLTTDKNASLFENFILLYKQKDSRSLFLLARLYYNDQLFNTGIYEDLFACLTNVFVQVKNEDGNWVWRYEMDYSGVEKLNQLIYWASHFRDYKWDVQKKMFVNNTETLLQKPSEISLFNKLSSTNDSIALNAFISLTYYDSSVLANLPFSDLEFHMSDTLPLFQFHFLQVLGRYRHYFQDKKVSLDLGEKAKIWFDKLAQENISFKQRYKLENEVIANATPNEMSALEFWSLISEENWSLTYSAGRIIDKYYSYHWKEIIEDTSQLNSYLKKAALFDGLGIIGNCNKYLFKFQPADPSVIDRLKFISKNTNDAHMAASIQNIFTGLKPKVYDSSKSNDGNYDTSINDLAKEYAKLLSQPHESYQNPVNELTACINYNQIDDLIILLKQQNKLDSVYNFLHDDFGFPVELDSIEQREAFLKLYKNHSYKEVCAAYLDTLGIDFRTDDGALDYQKIYNILEFDNVDALAGGGGGRRQDGIFLIIKLLEFTFNTGLDFPKKSCNSGGIYSCDLIDRSRAWINFLADRKLIVIDNTVPLSISSIDF